MVNRQRQEPERDIPQLGDVIGEIIIDNSERVDNQIRDWAFPK